MITVRCIASGVLGIPLIAKSVLVALNEGVALGSKFWFWILLTLFSYVHTTCAGMTAWPVL